MGIGWIMAIFAGGMAGWIASMLMKANTGLFTNILLGIVGAGVAGFVFGLVGVNFSGVLGYIIAGIAGASLLIWGWRRLRR